ncbi:MAG: hypothetical protein Q9217_002759 [Psora testacea]
MLWLIFLYLLDNTSLGDLSTELQCIGLALTLLAAPLAIALCATVHEARQGWRQAFEAVQKPVDEIVEYCRQRNAIIKEQKIFIINLYQVLRDLLDRVRGLERIVQERGVENAELNIAVDKRDTKIVGLEASLEENEQIIASLPENQRRVIDLLRENAELRKLNTSKDVEIQSLAMVQKERDESRQLSMQLTMARDAEVQEKKIKQMEVASLTAGNSMLEAEKADLQQRRDTLERQKKQLTEDLAAAKEVHQRTITTLQAEKVHVEQRRRETAMKLSKSVMVEATTRSQLMRLESRLTEATHAYEVQKQWLKDVNAENGHLLEEIEKRTQQLRDAKDSMAFVRNDNDALRSEMTSKEYHSEKQQKLLEKRIAQSLEAKRAAIVKLQACQWYYGNLNQRYVKASEELNMEKTRAWNYHNDALKVRSVNQELQEKLQKLRMDNEQQQKTNDRITECQVALVERLQVEIEDLRANQRKNKGAIAFWERRWLSVDAENASHRDKLDSLNKRIKQLEHNDDSANAKAKSSHNEIERLKNELSLTKANSGSRTEMARLTKEVQSNGQMLRKLRVKLESKDKIPRRVLLNIIDNLDDDLPDGNGTSSKGGRGNPTDNRGKGHGNSNGKAQGSTNSSSHNANQGNQDNADAPPAAHTGHANAAVAQILPFSSAQAACQPMNDRDQMAGVEQLPPAAVGSQHNLENPMGDFDWDKAMEDFDWDGAAADFDWGKVMEDFDKIMEDEPGSN